jgi:hypothetical protein
VKGTGDDSCAKDGGSKGKPGEKYIKEASGYVFPINTLRFRESRRMSWA